jgi:putative PEP-CTERM system histidine kinase
MNPALLGFVGYAAAALAFLALAALLALRRRGDAVGRLLLVAVLGQVAWGAAMAGLLTGSPIATPLAPLTEAIRNLLWVLFLIRLGTDAGPAPAIGSLQAEQVDRVGRRALVVGLVLASASAGAELIGSDSATLFAARTLAAIFGLVCLEQVYRNASPGRRWAIKFLALALLALFAFDLLMYSEAMLFGRINGAWWIARGYANVLLVPLLAIAAARNPQWKLDIGVSRQAVFHSAALSIAGGYLVLIAGGGYWLRWFGGEWGEIAAALLVFAALLGLAVFLTSGRIRARLRVFLAKHFFTYRFDYREEWMRLTGLLASDESGELAIRAITGLGQPVDSASGALWIESDGAYRFEGGIRWQGDRAAIPSDAPLVRLLRERDWIVDLDTAVNSIGEWRAIPDDPKDPRPEAGLPLPPAIAAHADGWLVVPLTLERELLGFVLLDKPLAPQPFDWETRDLLKAAARQIASHLGLERTLDKLIRAQQFESFNRMSAFVVHDLKNLVAQLGLMTKNAQRHRDNPEFQADMLATVENVMERMQGLLLQLRVGAKPVEKPAPVNLADTLQAAVAARRALRPEPRIVRRQAADGSPEHAGELAGSVQGAPDRDDLFVMAHRDRLERVIGHLIQNAAEACDPATGRVELTLGEQDGRAVIEVRDNGRGMSESFLREKLFQPFTSTKAHGMGIGAFESREYLRELGGMLEVESTEGVGTIFRVRLPLARAPVTDPKRTREEEAGSLDG